MSPRMVLPSEAKLGQKETCEQFLSFKAQLGRTPLCPTFPRALCPQGHQIDHVGGWLEALDLCAL